MTSAREQAREAGRRTLETVHTRPPHHHPTHQKRGPTMSLRDEARTAWLEEAGPGPFTRAEVEAAADCASRHWEPIVRDLMNAVSIWNPHSPALERAKEALG